jgi:LuxR family maltose regulon positive regulatory protein
MTRPDFPIAKIARPVFGGTYPRKRLFRSLDRARKRPIVWISGPAGCGKTTLLSTYLSTRGDPCVWYRMDESDNDFASFFYYMGLAARRSAPRKTKPLPLLTPEYLPGLSTFTKRYFEQFFGRLKPGGVVVFDNYQKVGTGSGIHEVMRDGLSLLPEGMHAFVVSRSDPPPLFAREQAHQRMERIGWKELRLTPEEARGFARVRGKKLGAGKVLSLQDRSDGWAAGLVLLLEESPEVFREPRRMKDTPPERVFEYFAGEIFDGLGEKEKSFLLKSACLPRMTAAMAVRITGLRRAGTILSYLNRNNYFTEMRWYAEPVYEYHPLFREFLLARAREIFPGSLLRRVRNSAGAILEEAGYDEDALPVFRDLGDREGMVRIILRQATRLVQEGRSGTLAEWISSLPENTCEENPWLLYWKGVCRLPSRPGDSLGDFEEAFQRFRHGKDPEGAFQAWSGVVDSIVYGSVSLKSIDAWFATLADLMKVHESFPSPGIEAQVTCTAIKALALRRPPSVDMEEWMDRAMTLARSTQDIPLKFSLLLNAAYFRFHGGDLQSVDLLLDSLRELVRKADIPSMPRLGLFWLEAAHANMNGLHDHCMALMKEGIAFADATGVHHMDFLLMCHGTLSSLHRRDLPTAKRLLARMASTALAAKPWETAFYHQLAAWEALGRGNQARALLHSDHCIARSEEAGNPWLVSLAHLQRAFIRERNGGSEEASRHLERARRIGSESRMEFIRFACLLAAAWFSLRRGDEASGLASLQDGLRIGREKGYVDIYLWCPGLLERIAAEALNRGIEPEYVRDLVRKNALLPDDTFQYTERWPWPIRIYTLGKFELILDGKPLLSSRKAQQKPLLMLKALISMRSRNITERQITDALWPEAEGDLAHQSFTTTLSRLRHLLGEEKALLLREGRLTLDTRYCWVDSFAFDSCLAQIDAFPPDGAARPGGGRTLRIAEQALALYRGSFLPGEFTFPPIITARERLRSKFLRAVGFFGRFLEREERWAEAIACYRKGLEVDELAEVFYQRLMTCHWRVGQAAEAAGVYDRCRKTLATVLGILPSPETEALRKSLR